MLRDSIFDILRINLSIEFIVGGETPMITRLSSALQHIVIFDHLISPLILSTKR